MSDVRKRSISLLGHRTSYSIEDRFQDALAKMAQARGLSLAALIGQIDAKRSVGTNLSSALRLEILADLEERLAERESTIIKD